MALDPTLRRASARPVALWLLVVAALVFAMAVIGAITRLTESGLSIVRWEPITGAIPPLSAAAWQAEFAAYQASPQYRAFGAGMTLADFQHIYFWEWLHRLWGRLIGLAYALPLLVFWLRGMIPAGWTTRLVAILLLGALQAVIGWWMVASGLVDRPSVSHWRLAIHLGLALIIYAAVLRAALDLLVPAAPEPDAERLRWPFRAACAAVATTVVWGAFTAGTDAGMIYAEFPTMGGALVPSELWTAGHGWANAVEDPASIQFVHRWLAMATVGLCIVLWRAGRSHGPRLSRLTAAIGHMALLQAGLGIATLLAGVPVWLGALHQAGALILIGLLVALGQAMPAARAVPVAAPAQ